MPSAGFEPANRAGERLQTHVFDRSATGIGNVTYHSVQNIFVLSAVSQLKFVISPVTSNEC
jgi:hypothetical protein